MRLEGVRGCPLLTGVGGTLLPRDCHGIVEDKGLNIMSHHSRLLKA